MTAPIAHKAVVRHMKTGWLRWQAECPCGWSQQPYGAFTAQDLADDHNDQHGVPDADLPLSCTCLNPATLEFSDEHPCPYCQRLDAEELA